MAMLLKRMKSLKVFDRLLCEHDTCSLRFYFLLSNVLEPMKKFMCNYEKFLEWSFVVWSDKKKIPGFSKIEVPDVF